MSNEQSKTDQAHSAWADAGMDLTDASIDWAVEHRASLEKCAASGCVSSAALIHSLDNYFERSEALEELEDAEVNEADAALPALRLVVDAPEDLHLTVTSEDVE